jgi:co-chaperonin GroES (HSP10)
MNKLPSVVLNSRLIVEPLQREDQKVGEIFIPGSANAELSEGKVVLVDNAISIKVGEVVLYPTGSGVGQVFNNKPCVWLSINDIWAII